MPTLTATTTRLALAMTLLTIVLTATTSTIVLPVAAAEAGSNQNDDPVADLSPSLTPLGQRNFEGALMTASSLSHFIMFYSPSCKHSAAAAAEMEKLAVEAGERINLARVNCRDHRRFCRQRGVVTYPTLLLYKHGVQAAPMAFRKARVVEQMRRFLQANMALGRGSNRAVMPETRVRHHQGDGDEHEHDTGEGEGEGEGAAESSAAEYPDDIVLRYFGTRGRAEPIRLILEACGIDWYEQVHYDKDSWPQAKADGLKSGLLPFGQVPQLSFGDTHLVQSFAIASFLGEVCDLHGRDRIERATVNMALGGVEDLRKRYAQLIYSPDFADKRDQYEKDVSSVWLQRLDDFLSGATVKKPFVLGDYVSVADFFLFDVVNLHLGLIRNITEAYPLKWRNLERHHQAVRSIPRIQAYIKSPRRPTHGSGPSAFFDNEANPSQHIAWDPTVDPADQTRDRQAETHEVLHNATGAQVTAARIADVRNRHTAEDLQRQQQQPQGDQQHAHAEHQHDGL